jgi:hypothetical protein
MAIFRLLLWSPIFASRPSSTNILKWLIYLVLVKTAAIKSTWLDIGLDSGRPSEEPYSPLRRKYRIDSLGLPVRYLYFLTKNL